jgi:hypothetical protein
MDKELTRLYEEARNRLQDCINELCQYCGKYKNEHEGACDGCKWEALKW